MRGQSQARGSKENGRFRSPSPFHQTRLHYQSASREHYIIADKLPKDIHIKVYAEPFNVIENH